MVKISIIGWINGLLTELLFSPSLIKPVLTSLQENTQIAVEKNGRKARKTAGKLKKWQNYWRP
jgi:hypothetical protein